MYVMPRVPLRWYGTFDDISLMNDYVLSRTGYATAKLLDNLNFFDFFFYILE